MNGQSVKSVTGNSLKITKRDELERAMATQLRMSGINYQTQVMPIPGRRLTYDFCLEPFQILIEVQGGIWNNGKHGRGTGILIDQEKLFLAQLHGWRLLQVAENQIRDGRALKWIQQLMAITTTQDNTNE